MASNEKQRVTGLGGVFFRTNDPKTSSAWYEKHLGIAPAWEFGTMFKWRDFDHPDKECMTVWSQFKRDTDYFGDSGQSTMLNYRVDNLDLVLAQLREEGVWVDEKREDSDFGKFGWIKDCDGNRVELWEPPKENAE